MKHGRLQPSTSSQRAHLCALFQSLDCKKTADTQGRAFHLWCVRCILFPKLKAFVFETLFVDVMLELLYEENTWLSEQDPGPSSVVAFEHVSADGADVLIARCSADGTRLDIFRWDVAKSNLDVFEAGKVIATRGTTVSTMEWLLVTPDQPFLCVGFSHGGVSLFTPRGAVCLSFLLVPRPVVRFRDGPHTRGRGAEADSVARRWLLVLLECPRQTADP